MFKLELMNGFWLDRKCDRNKITILIDRDRFFNHLWSSLSKFLSFRGHWTPIPAHKSFDRLPRRAVLVEWLKHALIACLGCATLIMFTFEDEWSLCIPFPQLGLSELYLLPQSTSPNKGTWSTTNCILL